MTASFREVSKNLSEQQRAAILELLEHNGLPAEDLDQVEWLALIVWEVQGQVKAMGGIEYCDGAALLRSIATDSACRGRGIAARIVGQLHKIAFSRGFVEIFLLTNDAQSYFQEKIRQCPATVSLDYQPIAREDAPLSIRRSSQFSKLCPASAVLMRSGLQGVSI